MKWKGKLLTVAEGMNAPAWVLPRPWRVERDTGSCYVVDAEGDRLCSPSSEDGADVPMQLLVDLANNHPTATLAQIINAGMREILNSD